MIDANKKDLAMKRFNKSIVTWERFIEEAKGHEKDAVVVRLPEPIKREYAKPGTDELVNFEFPAMSFVTLPNGQILPVLVHFDENGRPSFGVSEEILQMFVEDNKEVIN
jgi:hypothetical protein